MKKSICLCALIILMLGITGCEKKYSEEYFTPAETEEAEWIQPEQPYTPDEEAGESVSDEAHVKEIRAIVKELYPEEKPKQIVCGGKQSINDLSLIFYNVYNAKGEVYCVICVDEDSTIYYLCDEENNIYVPIEFNENGARLVG